MTFQIHIPHEITTARIRSGPPQPLPQALKIYTHVKMKSVLQILLTIAFFNEKQDLLPH